MLKKVLITENPHEVDICLYLSSLQHQPENHAVPILEVFMSPHFDNVQLVVMPRLRTFEDPWFDTVGEVVDAFRQIFEVSQLFFLSYPYLPVQFRASSSFISTLLLTGVYHIRPLKFRS